MSVKKLAILGAAHGHVSYVTDGLAGRKDVELVAVADHDEERRRSFSENSAFRPMQISMRFLLRTKSTAPP